MVSTQWAEGAVRDLEFLDREVARRILRKLDWYVRNTDSVTPEPLSGEFKGMYKLRVGDWRVIYTIESKTVTILAVGHRREIYKIL